MTLGELARLARADLGLATDLRVVPVAGWRRAMPLDATGLPFVPPSPNLRSLESLYHYPGTCLFEGTNLSVGRGSDARVRADRRAVARHRGGARADAGGRPSRGPIRRRVVHPARAGGREVRRHGARGDPARGDRPDRVRPGGDRSPPAGGRAGGPRRPSSAGSRSISTGWPADRVCGRQLEAGTAPAAIVQRGERTRAVPRAATAVPAVSGIEPAVALPSRSHPSEAKARVRPCPLRFDRVTPSASSDCPNRFSRLSFRPAARPGIGRDHALRETERREAAGCAGEAVLRRGRSAGGTADPVRRAAEHHHHHRHRAGAGVRAGVRAGAHPAGRAAAAAERRHRHARRPGGARRRHGRRSSAPSTTPRSTGWATAPPSSASAPFS